MPRWRRALVLLAIAAGGLVAGGALAPDGASPIAYRFTFPEPEHHWMQVEATFADLAAGPLELRMSRSSPGRYSMHDFAKNVYDVTATGADGKALAITRPDPYGWTLTDHPSSLTVRYKVFGNLVDGTYLGIDRSHAHLNMPASVMFARGLGDRPAVLTWVPPDSRWQVATQLHRGTTPFEYTAPNLQYLMDSPTELGPVALRTFQEEGTTFRFAAHHTGTDAELDDFLKDVQRIVGVEKQIFGEFPRYEPGYYTFLADYLPWANGDGMEHRNSTVMTSSGSIRGGRPGLLDTVAHEFFHSWNIERIRPRSLEPFDFEQANISSELWLGEGFTEYYAPLALSRSGLEDLRSTVDAMNRLLQSIIVSPGRDYQSAAEMSQMAVFTDGGRAVDRTNWSSSFISYYSYGGALALALDLSLRGRGQRTVTLDDFMRAMWQRHGKPSSREGYVDRPYTLDDAEHVLADVSGDAAFAREFFAKYVYGRDLPDYASLAGPAGLLLRPSETSAPWWGDIRLDQRDGVRIAVAPLSNTPAYKAGLDLDDQIRAIDGMRVTAPDDVVAAIRRKKPGAVVSIDFTDRTGAQKTARVTLERDPRVELVPIEQVGLQLSPAQISFREAWLGRH